MTVRNLFTTPVTVKAVAEIAFLAANPKKLISNPKIHDKATAKNAVESNQFPAFIAKALKTSEYSPVMIQNTGAIINDNRLLYSTKPHVFNPRLVTMCLM
uniref:Uncharacterized protein n=1 Tax=Opuntia streptacantha TaxID=393608 RepID=A0A7C9F489_OPUST